MVRYLPIWKTMIALDDVDEDDKGGKNSLVECSDSDGDEYHNVSDHLTKDTIFDSMNVAKLAIKHFCTTKKAPVFVKYSCPEKFCMKGVSDDCPFVVSCNLQTNAN